MRGLVADTIAFSNVDGPGNRFVVFMQGCNFDCVACHNQRLDVADALVSVHVSGSAAAHLVPGDRVNVVIDGTRGVCETPVAA